MYFLQRHVAGLVKERSEEEFGVARERRCRSCAHHWNLFLLHSITTFNFQLYFYKWFSRILCSSRRNRIRREERERGDWRQREYYMNMKKANSSQMRKHTKSEHTNDVHEKNNTKPDPHSRASIYSNIEFALMWRQKKKFLPFGGTSSAPAAAAISVSQLRKCSGWWKKEWNEISWYLLCFVACLWRFVVRMICCCCSLQIYPKHSSEKNRNDLSTVNWPRSEIRETEDWPPTGQYCCCCRLFVCFSDIRIVYFDLNR